MLMNEHSIWCNVLTLDVYIFTCFHTVFIGIFLDYNSLPPDFASRVLKSLVHARKSLLYSSQVLV